MNLAHNFDDFLFTATPAIYVIYAASWFCMLAGEFKRRRSKNSFQIAKAFRLFTSSALVFGGTLFLMMATSGYIVGQAQSEFYAALDSPLEGIYINGRPMAPTDTFRVELRNMYMSMFRYNHTHPTHRVPLTLQSKGVTINLELGRDSDDPHVYWVFDNDYHVSGFNDIGKITTSALDTQ